MKKLLFPIQLNESSYKVQQLHLAMAALGMPVADRERLEKKAGESTVNNIREIQHRLGITPDSSVVMDATTAAAIEKELKSLGIIDDNSSFSVSGTVRGGKGRAARAKLLAFDIDLKAAGIYRKIKTLEEIKRNGGFEFLGESMADRDGNYIITFSSEQFKHAERKKADVVVYAVLDETIIGRSRMVNAEDYTETGAVTRLDIFIEIQDKGTEYDLLINMLNPFLKENGVSLAELAGSKDQISFSAGELNADAGNITIAAAAAKMITDNELYLSHELLYALGRKQYKLELFSFYNKKEIDIREAIAGASDENIIRTFKPQEIDGFINALLETARNHFLNFKPDPEKKSVSELLSAALPEPKQQVAFLNAVSSFEGTDYKDFWHHHLPATPEFRDKPELVKSVLFTHQLSLITANHQPLVEALQKSSKQNDATELLRMNHKDWIKLLKKTGVPNGIPGADDGEKAAHYARQLQSVLTGAYPTQKIAIMLENGELPMQDDNVADGVRKFLAKNAGFDFSKSRIHDFENEIGVAGSRKKDELKSELLRLQRVYQVSASPETMTVLLKNNLDSARSIANIPRKSFIKMYGSELGGEEYAFAIHERSSYINTRSEMAVTKMREYSHGVTPAYAMEEKEYMEAMTALQNQVPNYSELFGSPDICECEQCRSVYGAAAYFVDLLRFLWRGVHNHDGKSPLDMLAKRRPDLLFLPLTCENTDTIIPYIDLVNEVMEFYVEHGSLTTFEGYDTGDATVEELRADPQHTSLEAYRKLKDAKYPFSLPYHQPLHVIRTYGEHLKTSRDTAMEAVQNSTAVSTVKAIEAESLKISPEEYSILTKESFSGVPDATALYAYFGYANNGQLESMASVREFLTRSGVKYTDLVELIKTRFINPHQGTFDFLQDLFTDSTLDAAEIYDRLKKINAGTLTPSADATIMASLNTVNITSADFITWVQANFAGFNSVITLHQSNSLCDLDTTFLRTLGNVYSAVNASGITTGTWSKFHRFIRLWRKLGWTIHETDLVLTALGQSDITTVTISKLSSVLKLNNRLKKPLNQVAVAWGTIDTYGDKSLYKKLFLNKTILNLDPAFKADKWGNYLNDPAALLKDHIPSLLAAFRMSQEDLDAILATATVVDAVTGNPRLLHIATDKLNLPNLSTIYRFAVLSKALKYKVPDFCLLLKLFNTNPFSRWNNATGVYDSITPSVTNEFYDLALKIKETGFKPDVLNYIFSGALPADSKLGLNTEKAIQTARIIRESFATIEQDHPDLPASPLTIDIIRNKLSLTYQAETVNMMSSILDGTVGFTIITTNNLNIVIPAALEAKYSYTKASGRLSCTGVMPDADLVTLKALNANAAYKAAVDTLYKIPEEFLKTNFNGVFVANMNVAIATLLDHPAQAVPATPEEKLKFIYDNFMPLLKRKLREDAITQHISALTGLSENASKLITRTDLTGLISLLAKQGQAGKYFSDNAWTTFAFDRTDAEINFEWGAGSPDTGLLAGNNFSARWESYITAPASGEFTFIAEVDEADETFRIYLDDVLVLEKPAANVQLSWEFLASLNASKMHKLKVEYAEGTGNAGIRLFWKTPTSAATIIPASSAYPAAPVDAFAALASVYHRAAKFISGFGLNETEIAHLITYKADFSAIDFKALTPVHWNRISDYISLRDAIPQAQATLIDVFKLAETTSPAPVLADLTNLLAQATAWDSLSLTYFVTTHFGFAVADFRNEIALLRLKEAVGLVANTGISADTVARWGKVETDFDQLNSSAQLIKSTVKAKYEEQDWMDVAGKLSDKIREHQKQALISYLLMKPELQAWGAIDADGLFEYFLIDVQMGSCMDTSRIVQGNAALQMFVNRCLLNLESDLGTGNEKGVSPDAIDSDRWEWMKNYRVWEANRKVFLYPENWLEPEWRTDRSTFFKDLESELVQNDITDRSVETAFRNYLAKLNEVANLEICGIHKENDERGSLKLLHVFGRTHNAPYQVYYRTWDKYMKWTAWEKVQADVRNIEDGDFSGVHLVPVVWKNRLFLFWPEFIEKKQTNSSASSKTAKTASEQNTLGSLEPSIYWEIRLAWTEYVDKKWSAKQLGKEFLKQMTGSVVPNASRIRMVTHIDADNQLNILTHCEFDQAWVELGAFILSDITSKIETRTFSSAFEEDGWDGYSLKFMNFKKNAKLRLLDDDYLKKVVNHKVLVNPVRSNYSPTLKDPFFYSDAYRSYFVRPVDIKIYDRIKNPDRYKPDFPTMVDDSRFREPFHIPKVGPDDYLPLPDEILTGGIDIVSGNAMRANVRNLPQNRSMLMLSGSNFNDTHVMSGDFADGSEPRSMLMSGDIADGSEARPMMMMSGSGSGEVRGLSTTVDIKSAARKVRAVSPAFSGIYDLGHKYWPTNYRWDKGLEFHTFYHPFSHRYVKALNQDGVSGLLECDTIIPSDDGAKFTNKYQPNFNNGLVQKPADFPTRTYFKENVCFDVYGANNMYNWELFFHAPLYIATRLSKNGKYEEAMKWFHYIFNPTTDERPAAGQSETSRYWQVLPFKTTPAKSLEEYFLSLSPNNNPGSEEPAIGEWRDNPFDPHLIARNRPLAYMKNVVIKYVENLLEWGDSLFRQFTRESVNESLQIYVIANHILGPRPEKVPKRGEISAESYNTLKTKLDDFSNAIVQMENLFPYSSEIPTGTESTGSNLLGIGESLYFCIPNNTKILEYWDRAADRLFKIRHCMDINGVERKLALFAPAIDPAALIQAASQGLSLGSILADLSSPPPIYRFSFLVQKANEFCSEVKMLGSALLSVLEKKDGEEMSRLRASHETAMLELMTAIKERQVLDARVNKETILKARDVAKFKLQHYNALFSEEAVTVPGEPTIPANLTADSSLPADTSIPELVSDVDGSLVDSLDSAVKIIPAEQNEMILGIAGIAAQTIATMAEGIAGTMNFIPTFSGEIEPFGCGMSMSYGGSNIAGGISGLAKIPAGIAGVLNYMAAHSAKMAAYIRREQEWNLQANLAAKEIIQLDKQITSADIRIQVAEKELSNHLQQITHAQESEQFLRNKFTNQELYQWMKEQLFSVYKQSYNMSYDMAKKAEKAYKYEIGNEIASFIQYGYWDNSYQGLLAGEKLQMALRQLEKSYLEENKRELELRKNVSLAFLNPLALQELRQTGKCYVSIPEELLDMDFQGHYFRRIKSVSLSIPCIAGPMTTIACTLRLLKNTVRTNTSMNEDGNYEHMNDEGAWTDDDRFRVSNVPVQSIAVTTGQADAGLFELNFRDERYLPFEGAGAISEWKIELTADEELRQFDYSTISDIILHMSYTAREDAGLFKDKAVAYIKTYLTNLAELSTQPLMRMFSLRHEFSTEWHRFLNPLVAGADQQIKLTFRKEHFPFFTRDRKIDVMQVDILSKTNRAGDYHLMLTVTDTSDTVIASTQISMPENPTYGGMQKATLEGTAASISVEDINIFSELTMKLKHNSDANYHSLNQDPDEVEDLFMVIHYKLSD